MRGRLAIAALTALGLLAIAPSAQATYDPIGSGTTRLTLDAGFSSFLKANGISLSAKAGAKRRGRSITLLVTEGNVDPTLGMGEIGNEGTIAFTAEGKNVPLREVTVRAKRDTLIAKVGGSQLKVASSDKRSSKRQGFGTTYTAKALKLTAKVATRLNKKLRPENPFVQGQLLGTLASNAQPKLATILPEGRASISLDPAFAAKLDSHFVSVNPIFPAEHPGAFTFPVIGGSQLAPGGTEGTLRTGGQLEFLQLGAGQVFQDELWLDMVTRTDTAEVEVLPTPAFPGKLGRVGAYELVSPQIASDLKARTITLTGPLVLTAQTAGTFDEAFAGGKPTFAAGEPLGTLGFVAMAQ